MTQPRDFAYGLPSVPRSTMPSMYEMLSWVDSDHQKQPSHPTQENTHPKEEEKDPDPAINLKENIIENISEVKSQYGTCKGKKISKSCTKHHQLYQYKESRLKESQSIVQRSKSKVQVAKVEKTQKSPKKLDPYNEADRVEIQARKKRIKEFQLVTRDLPNTAFTTYYGKPAFEAYGRGGSKSNLLSHNVMPHKGDNHPKSVQSYYSALIKGKKTASISSVSHIPRKPIAQTHTETQEVKQEPINIPLEKPDLINNIRFTAQNPQEKVDKRIPSNKVTAIKQKISKKSDRKQKKPKQRPKSKDVFQTDGLKYMNNREDLLKIMQNKRLAASRLAYKVTECYPCQWQNQQKLKQSTKLWQNAKIAGLPSKISEPVAQLLKNTGKANRDE